MTDAKRVKLSEDDLSGLTTDQLVSKWTQQNKYVEFLEKVANLRDEELPTALTAAETQASTLNSEYDDKCLAEGGLDCLAGGSGSGSGEGRSALLDPAVNYFYHTLHSEIARKDARLKRLEAESAAWTFAGINSSVSVEEKRLMAQCGQLLRANSLLGDQLPDTRLSHIDAETTLQRTLRDELAHEAQVYEELSEDLETEICTIQGSLMALAFSVQGESTPTTPIHAQDSKSAPNRNQSIKTSRTSQNKTQPNSNENEPGDLTANVNPPVVNNKQDKLRKLEKLNSLDKAEAEKMERRRSIDLKPPEDTTNFHINGITDEQLLTTPIAMK